MSTMTWIWLADQVSQAAVWWPSHSLLQSFTFATGYSIVCKCTRLTTTENNVVNSLEFRYQPWSSVVRQTARRPQYCGARCCSASNLNQSHDSNDATDLRGLVQYCLSHLVKRDRFSTQLRSYSPHQHLQAREYSVMYRTMVFPGKSRLAFKPEAHLRATLPQTLASTFSALKPA